MTLNFQQALDPVSHQHMFTILRHYGISYWFAEPTQILYEQALASVQIKGYLAVPIEIRSGIRQGCPFSMIL